MKKILLITFLLPLMAIAQRDSIAGIGMTAGYSSLGIVTAELYTKYKLGKHIMLHPLNFRFLASNSPSVPVIIGMGAGYKVIKPLELYGALNFHAAGMDNKDEYKCFRGLRPGAGFYLTLYKHLILSGSISGGIKTIGIGF